MSDYNWEKYDINLRDIRGGKGFCPKCHHTRKHKTDRSLSVDTHTGLFNCHNPGCDFKGCAKTTPSTNFINQKKTYSLPPQKDLSDTSLIKIDPTTLSYFQSRGISNNTLLRAKVTDSIEYMPQSETNKRVINFNYIRDGVLVNVKYRSKDKEFKLVSNAELIFYNLDNIKDYEEAIIVEGEIDALSWMEANIPNVISVPNGANLHSQRMEYLDNSWESIKHIKKWYLCCDNDEAGQALQKELSRRLGAENCYVIHLDGYKDSNEVLLVDSENPNPSIGKAQLKAILGAATPYPIEGIITMDELFDKVEGFYENGYPKGVDSGDTEFDKHLTLAKGQLTIVTGIPGHGKDEFINHLMAKITIRHGWSWGISNFEEPAEYHVTKLAEKFTGKSFDFRKDPRHRMTQDEKNWAIGMIDQHFNYLNIDEIGATTDVILDKARELVARKGIDGLVINPWNCIEHHLPKDQSLDLYISQVLGKLTSFAKKNDIHIILVAHPFKMKKVNLTDNKYEVPTLYSISGSAHFYNKTHNGVCVYRHFNDNTVEIFIQKVKWSWLGKVGSVLYTFDTYTRQYHQASVSPD